MTHAGQNRTEKGAEHVHQNCSKENPFPCTCWAQKAPWLNCLATKAFKELFSYHYIVPPYARQVSESVIQNLFFCFYQICLSKFVNYLGYKVPNKVCTEHITLCLKNIWF